MANVRDIDKGLKKILSSFRELTKTSLNVGVFSDAVNTKEKGASYVADYAITNEYGSKNIPERSFMRSTIDEQGNKWTNSLADVFTNVAKNNLDLNKQLYKTGAIARNDIIAKIDSNINPPNAPSTIKKKGMSKNKTLIDTGILRSSIEARIERK
jgi:hypothetical protein